MPYATLPGLVRAGAVYYDLSLGYLDEDGIAGRQDLAKPRCSTASMTISAAIPGANATTDYCSTLVGSAFNTYWGALAVDLFPFCGERREHGWQEGYRCGCPHQNRLHPIRECCSR